MDDCTFSHGNQEPQILSLELTQQYKKISQYMVANKLVINDDKTKLVVIGSRQASELRNQVRIEAGDHIVRPISTAKLLGATISQDAKWKNHILGTEHSP